MSTRFSQRRSPRKGFTLFELLIAVAIIAVLAVLLFPALLEMKARSKQVGCVSRLQSLGKAFHLYAADNNGVLPAHLSSSGGALQTAYFNQLAPYLDLTESFPYTNPDGSLSAIKKKWNSRFFCPAAPQNPPEMPAWILGTYGMSTCFSGASSSPPHAEYSRSLASISKPASTAMFTCLKQGYVVQPAFAFIGENGWLANWHNGGFNVIFVDGHCQNVNDITSLSDPRKVWWSP